MSRILVDQIRSNSASADAMTLDGSGNVTVPGNLVVTGNANCNGTPTGFGVGGKILQVQSTQSNTTVNAGGTTLQLLTLSITPAASNSKILILASHSVEGVPSSNAYGTIFLYRGALNGTEIFNTSAGDNHNAYNYANLTINYVDSPNTTSAQSYTTGINRGSGGTATASTNGTTYTLILMEIGA